MAKPSLVVLAVFLSMVFLSADCYAASVTIEDAFSPDQGATALVVKAIGESRESIRVAAYSFTSRPIAQTLVDACDRGVDIRIVFDKSQRTNSLLKRFFDASCVQTRMNDRYAIMHNKFMIIDGITLETGSFNFTKAAERRNAENVLVIHDDPQLVKDYMQQWENLWQQGKDFTLQSDHKH